MEIGRSLIAQHWTLATAESCTGGLIGHRITSVSGSSEYFVGGMIAYANEVKIRELGVNRRLLMREGAVSAPVARQMARGIRRRFGSDIGIGVTGIAGPGGGTEKKPVGLVFIGLSRGNNDVVRRFQFKGSRETIKAAAGEAALRMVKSYLHEKGVHHG
jgi:nicotinamide-nucleotide amidase